MCIHAKKGQASSRKLKFNSDIWQRKASGSTRIGDRRGCVKSSNKHTINRVAITEQLQ